MNENDWLINKQTIRDRLKSSLCPKWTDKILDVGCDGGSLVKYFQQFADVYGIDINKTNELVRNVSQQDATKTNFPDNHFDKIYSSHCIEHIVDSYLLFWELSRILKAEGTVVLIYPFELFQGMVALRLAYRMRTAPWMVHRQIYYPRKIINIIRETNLTHINSKLFFAKTPQWLTVLKKRG